MKKHAFKRAAAAAALSASALGAAGSFAVMTAGTADARPIESPNCSGIWDAMDSSMHMMQAYYGVDQAEYDWWEDTYYKASANYTRHCL
jgi:hypothetical protein